MSSEFTFSFACAFCCISGLFEPLPRTLLFGFLSCFCGVSRFDPPIAADACQLATGLNR